MLSTIKPSRVVRKDVTIILEPPWFTPYEQSQLWIAGLKPGFAFRLVTDHMKDLNKKQTLMMKQLRTETAAEEIELTEEEDGVLNSPAMTSLEEMVRRGRKEKKRERDAANEKLDIVRTGLRIMEILNPSQNVKLLLAITQLQVRVRNWGLQREAESRNDNSGH